MRFVLIVKIAFVAAVVAGVLAVLVVLLSHFAVERKAAGRLYSSADKVPQKKAALVLGCAKILPNGRGNTFFYKRIDAASKLYHSGKCEYFIVSGDNSRKGYDEPTDMQQALIEKGVPEAKIYRDFAGFRTLDSVVRAKEIFGQDDIIVVSQPFHNKRAIYLASENGMQAVGYNSQDVSKFGGKRTLAREYLARVKMMLDLHILRTSPKFLGDKIELGVVPPPEPT